MLVDHCNFLDIKLNIKVCIHFINDISAKMMNQVAVEANLLLMKKCENVKPVKQNKTFMSKATTLKVKLERAVITVITVTEQLIVSDDEIKIKVNLKNVKSENTTPEVKLKKR